MGFQVQASARRRSLENDGVLIFWNLCKMKTTLKWRLAQRLELNWWKRYLKNKPEADYLSWKRGYWQTLLQSLSPYVKLRPGDKVLDAGCGPAGIFTILKQQQVTALDPLLDAYRELAHFKPQNYPYCQFIALPLELYQAPDVFDAVFCLNAINHVSNIGRCCDVLAKATKPNGYLVVSIDAHKYTLLKKTFRLLPGDALHPHQYDLREYENMLTKRGFEVVASIPYKSGRVFDYCVLICRRK